jgi:hypothetical protein
MFRQRLVAGKSDSDVQIEQKAKVARRCATQCPWLRNLYVSTTCAELRQRPNDKAYLFFGTRITNS